MSMQELFGNVVLWSAVIGLVSAQILKPIIHLVNRKGWDWRLILTTGGMPSSHTSAVIAMVVYSLMGLTWLSLAIGVVSALVVMSLTDTMHPPGGATVIACMTSNPSWSFVLMPVAAGALALIAISVLTGLVYRRMSRQEDVGSPTCDLGPPISPRGP